MLAASSFERSCVVAVQEDGLAPRPEQAVLGLPPEPVARAHAVLDPGEECLVFRLVVRSAGEMLGSESATSRRTLCPDGTLMELVEMSATHARGLSQEELDEWVASFPVETL
jgi:hypothetical protein